MKLRRTVYQSLPDGLQSVAQHGYVLLSPGLSWRKWHRTRDAFVDRFFDGRAEYDRYAEEFMNSDIVDICGAAAAEAAEDVTIWDAHRDEAERLYALLRKRRPETVVETGVYHGVSTASMLVALDANEKGTLYSVDNSVTADRASSRADGGTAARRSQTATGNGPTATVAGHLARARPSCAEPGSHALPPEREPGWIIPENLRDRWELRTGRSQRELPGLLAELGGMDFFLHDSEHSTAAMLFEFDLAWEWLRPGGLLVSHHVDWNEAFDTFVDERSPDHGLMSYTYFGEHPIPCLSGYAVKEPDRGSDGSSPEGQR